MINSTSESESPCGASIAARIASSKPPTEKPIRLPFRSASDRIGPSARNDEAVQRRRDQRTDALERQPLRHLDMQLRLVGDGQLRLPGRNQFRRIVRISRGDEGHLQVAPFERADLLGDIQGAWSGLTNQSSRTVSLSAALTGRAVAVSSRADSIRGRILS